MDPSCHAPPAKRLRTRRACDYCRDHRIRCEYGDGDICKHCQEYSIECQKAKPPPPDNRPRSKSVSDSREELKKRFDQGIEPGYLGPTEFSQLIGDHCVWSANASIRFRCLEARLELYDNAFGRNENRGRLVGRHPAIGETARRRAIAASTFSRVEEKLVNSLGGETILNDLMTTCRHNFLPLFPAVSVHESLGPEGPTPAYLETFTNYDPNSTPPTPLPPVIRFVLCAIPAMSRTVPPFIREGVVTAVNSVLDSMDFSLGMASLANIQLHLMISVNDGLWKRGPMGRAAYAAARMAIGLALHRCASLKVASAAQIMRRSRVWGACITADRWITLRLGQMPSIDLNHADAPFPSSHPDHRSAQDPGPISPFRFHQEVTQLADLLGRAYQLTSTPFGLDRTNDFSLLSWQLDYDLWLQALPEAWPYSAKLEVPHARSVLNLMSVAVVYTFVQPFLWPICPIPEAVGYRPAPHLLDELLRLSAEAIEWVAGPGTFYLDVWSTLLHPFVCCLLVQAKAAKAGDFMAGLVLDKGVQVIRDWAKHGENPPFVTFKRKDVVEMCEMLKLEDEVGFNWDFLSSVEMV